MPRSRRSFLARGAAAVVSRLWEIDDFGAFLVMTGFYDGTRFIRDGQNGWFVRGLTPAPRILREHEPDSVMTPNGIRNPARARDATSARCPAPFGPVRVLALVGAHFLRVLRLLSSRPNRSRTSSSTRSTLGCRWHGACIDAHDDLGLHRASRRSTRKLRLYRWAPLTP
jgi:hypothetical protein